MTTDPQTIEVDDPRVAALAKARQQRAHNSVFCPPWAELSEQEQRLSLLDARNYLRAAIDAGLVPAVPVPPTTHAGDRGAKAEALLLHFAAEAHRRKWAYDRGLGDDGQPIKSEAFGVLHRLGDEMNTALHKLWAEPAVALPPPADRAAVLLEIADFLRGLRASRTRASLRDIETDLREQAAAARRMADEAQQQPVPGPGRVADEEQGAFEAVVDSDTGPKADSKSETAEVVHACPPDGSGLTPCCGRTPFELPLSDRISSEAPTTCRGSAAPEQPAADTSEEPRP